MWTKQLRQIINPYINYLNGLKQVYKKFPPSCNYYKIQVLKPNDVAPAWNLIKNSYLVNDPLCKLLDIANSSDIHILQKYILRAAGEGISLKAVRNDNNEEIIGVSINSKFCPWDLEQYDTYCAQCKDENMRTVFRCYRDIAASYNMFEEHKYPYILDMAILSVDSKHQCKGIGYGLIRIGLAFARDMGYPLAKVECTSEYSALICGRCKMKLVKEMPFGAFKLGKVPGPPHTNVKIYISEFQKYHKCH